MNPVSAMNFSIRAIMPENQRSGQSSFFDLIMEPGSEQIVEIEVINSTSEEMIYNIDLAMGTTDQGGTLALYSRPEIPQDSTQRFYIDQIATMDISKVIIPGNQSARIPIRVTMPNEPFTGVILAGISVTEESPNASDEAGQEGIGLISEFMMSMPLFIRQYESHIENDLILTDVWADQVNHRNTIKANLQNIQPMLISQMEVRATVSRVSNGEILFERISDLLQMAPNSNFDFQIPLGGQAYQAGEYLLRIEVDSEERDWSFERTFTITDEEASSFNATDVTIQRISLWWFIAGGGGLLLLIIVIFILIFRRKNKRTQDRLLFEMHDKIKRLQT